MPYSDRSVLYLGDYSQSQTEIMLKTSWKVTKELNPKVDMGFS